MKTKLLLIIFIILILLFCFFRKTSSLSNTISITQDYKKNYVFAYSNFNNKNTIQCGNLKIINDIELNIHILFSKNYLGESITTAQIDIENLINKNKLKLISIEDVDNIKIYNCFSSFLPKYKWLKNKKINIQIAIKQNNVIIGYPLILSGF